MATIYDVTTKSNKMDWAAPFHRTGAFPLDRTSIFADIEDAKKYAAGGDDENKDSGTSYPGQIISVVTDGVVTPYQIEVDGSLTNLLGSAGVLDDPWEEWSEATTTTTAAPAAGE